MNYEKILEFAISVYKIPKTHMDDLQSLFLKSLLVVTIAIFWAFLAGVLLTQYASSTVVTVSQFGLYMVAFALSIPFQLKVIQVNLATNKASKAPLPEKGPLEIIPQYGIFLLAVASVGALAFLPYGTALAIEMNGTFSNIFATFKYVLFVAAVPTVLYTLAKTMGYVVATAAGKELSIFEVFSKNRGHFLSITILVLATVLPIELLTQLILSSMSGLMKISDHQALHGLIYLVESFVRSTALLLQLYFMWTAITLYIKQQKLFD